MTDEADDDEEEEERLLVLTASGERLRLDGGDAFDPHSADEEDEVDSLRVGLPMTPVVEMSVESTRLQKALSSLALAHMSKLLHVDDEETAALSGKWLNVNTFVLANVLSGELDEDELADDEDM